MSRSAQILTYFFVAFDRAYKDVSAKIQFSVSVFLLYDYLKKAMYHPCDLDLRRSDFLVN